MAAVAVAITAVVLWLTVDWRDEGVRAALHSWQEPVDDTMPVTIEVDRPPHTTLTCDLIARDVRFVVVGQVSVEVPAGGERRQRIDALIPLRGDGIAPELEGCTASR
nr:DUF4307 domain-containing protein [Phytoactinopolyspora alkaliphila]